MTISEFLASCEGKWSAYPPAPPGAIDNVVNQSGLSLPAEYMELLREFNGGDGFLDVQPCYLRVWTAEEVVGKNLDYQMPEYVPGFFGFGDTGGDSFLAFDTRGPQPWRVVSIPFVPMEEASASLVASSFAELLEHVIPPGSNAV